MTRQESGSAIDRPRIGDAARAADAASGPVSRRVDSTGSTDAWQPSSADLDARAQREALLARIRDAHAGHESWNERGRALLERFGPATDGGCYMAGCTATFTFASRAAYERVRDDVTATPEYAAWTGGKQLTTPETLSDGRVIVAVVLQRPD